MSEKEIQKKIVEQSGTIAKAICKGKDLQVACLLRRFPRKLWRDEHSERNYFCYISNTIHIATRINDF